MSGSLNKDKIYIEYQLEMDSRFHFGTGHSFGLIDRITARDSEGYLMVPGTTIKGILRENCEKIMNLSGLKITDPHDEKKIMQNHGNPEINDMIFGSKFLEGTLFFNDALVSDTDKKYFDSGELSRQRYLQLQTTVQTQTAISRLLGTVRPQALFNSEYGVASLNFKGYIFGFLSGVDIKEISDDPTIDGTDSLMLLLSSIYLMDRIGADRSRGAGKCHTTVTNLKVNDKDVNPDKLIENLESFTILHCERGG